MEEGTHVHSRSFCADKDEHVEEREATLGFWRETNVIKERGASSFHSFVVDDIELVISTS